ncbi:MAG: hypothetical protein ACQESB_07420, partial [Elusimicrobiota bacterium]
MGKLLVLTGLLGVLLCGNVAARERNFGLGVIVGDPTGVSAKLWTGQKTAFDAAAEWSADENGISYLHANYLIHSFNLLKVKRGSLPFYYGVGGTVRLVNSEKSGVRIPLGLAYIFEGGGVDFFVELVPLVILSPDNDFSINSALGLRYFFR